jgi:hypothetical protein
MRIVDDKQIAEFGPICGTVGLGIDTIGYWCSCTSGDGRSGSGSSKTNRYGFIC